MRKRVISILSIILISLTGCKISDGVSDDNSAQSKSETTILAADRNLDGKYDLFDSNNDGVLDVKNDALLSLDSGIDNPGIKLTEFELTDENGYTYTLDSIKEKDLTVICVWAYWCPDCFWELYGLTRLQDEEGNVYSYFDKIPDNIQWISLTVSGPDDYDMWKESVDTFSSYLHLPFSHIIDGSDKALSFVNSFRTLITEERDYTNTIPCVAIIDSDGNVLEVLYEQDGKTVANEIDKYLK